MVACSARHRERHNYLEQDFENIVTVNRLEKAVQSVLQVIGYSDVAGYFCALAPPVRISLAELARDAGFGYELAFFDLLRSRLQEALEAEPNAWKSVTLIVALSFSARKNWRPDCRALLEEIVNFARKEIDSSSSAELRMQLS